MLGSLILLSSLTTDFSWFLIPSLSVEVVNENNEELTEEVVIKEEEELEDVEFSEGNVGKSTSRLLGLLSLMIGKPNSFPLNVLTGEGEGEEDELEEAEELEGREELEKML